MEDQATELALLRQRAYSRTGTHTDRLRLAELERQIAATEAAEQPAVHRAVAALDEPSADAVVPESQPADAAPVRDSRRGLVLAASVGALIGAGLATAVTLTLVGATPVESDPSGSGSSLAVFDRDAGSIDDVENLVFPLDQLLRDVDGAILERADDVALRWVGAPAGHDVYAVRWAEDEQYHVCIIVEGSNEALSACTLEEDFRERGIQTSAYGMDLKWGPTGTEVWASTLR